MKRDCYFIDPMPAPRLTQGNLWTKAAKKYKAWKEKVRDAGVVVPESGAYITFHMPIPTGKAKEKEYKARVGKPHQQTPDLDNMIKALFDAVHSNDAHIFDIKASKIWSDVGMIEITYKEQQDGNS